MKILLISSLIATSILAAPAFAQGLYIGPNGVGIDSGVNRDRGYDRDRDRRDYRRRDAEEGRSAYERRPRHEEEDDD